MKVMCRLEPSQITNFLLVHSIFGIELCIQSLNVSPVLLKVRLTENFHIKASCIVENQLVIDTLDPFNGGRFVAFDFLTSLIKAILLV